MSADFKVVIVEKPPTVEEDAIVEKLPVEEEKTAEKPTEADVTVDKVSTF